MVKSILTLCIFSFLAFNSKAYSQDNIEINKRELVLSFPTIDGKVFDLFVKELKTMSGIELFAYCQEQQLFLIKYDSKIYFESETLVRKLHEKNKRYVLAIKKDTSIEQLIRNCSIIE